MEHPDCGTVSTSMQTDGFQPVFRQMGGQATMQMALRADQGILAYQWHMLQENAVPGLLPLSCFEQEGQVRLCWRVTSCQPLSMLFARKTWTVSELLRLFRQVHVLLSQMDALLLDAERLLLDSNHILIDPVRLSLRFAYCPLLEAEERPDAVRELLLSWLTGTCRLSGKDDSGRLSSLLLLLHEPSFHWSLLSQLFTDAGEPALHEVDPAADFLPVAGFLPGSIPIPEDALDREAPYGFPKTMTPVEKQGMRSQKAKNAYAKMPMVAPTEAPVRLPEVPGRRVSMGRIVLVQIVVVGCLTAVLAGGLLTGRGRDADMARAGMLLFGIALEVWGFCGGNGVRAPSRTLPQAEKTVHRPSSGLGATALKSGMRQMGTPSPFGAGNAIPKPGGVTESGMVAFEPEAVQAACSNQMETGLLRPVAGPCLYYQQADGQRLCMPLTKTPFLIGRLRDQVDGWLEHPTVGKMHAEIRLEEGHPSLVDLNSRNGTSINGTALVPYVPVRLHSNDRICISSQEIVFMES